MDVKVMIRKAERQDVPLLLHLVKTAREHRCGRMEWMSLDWNKTANDFYRSLGAVPIDDCTVYRLDAAAIELLSTEVV